jgi:hypothetical protein
VPQMVMEEVAQPARGLELGHVRVQIQPIETADFQRDVVTDNVRRCWASSDPPWREGR